MPWYFCCVLLRNQNTRFQDGRLEPLAAARKQFLHSLVPSASRLTVLSSCTQTPRGSPGAPSGGIRTKSGCFRLTGLQCYTPAVHPQTATCVHGCTRTAGLSQNPPGLVSENVILCPGGQGLYRPLIMSLALARRPDGLLSSGFQVRAQRVSIARSGQRAWACAVSSRDSTLAAWFLSRVCQSTSMLFRNSCLSAGDKWFIFTSLRCRTCRAPGETVKKASSLIQN